MRGEHTQLPDDRLVRHTTTMQPTNVSPILEVITLHSSTKGIRSQPAPRRQDSPVVDIRAAAQVNDPNGCLHRARSGLSLAPLSSSDGCRGQSEVGS